MIFILKKTPNFQALTPRRTYCYERKGQCDFSFSLLGQWRHR